MIGRVAGVWSTSRPNSVPSTVSPSPITRSIATRCCPPVDAFPVRQHLGSRRLHQPRRTRNALVGMRCCVSSTHRTRSRIEAPTMASM